MSKIENYTKVFKNALNLEDSKFSENIKYNEVEEWDSIGHMTLVSELEEEFKITFETDDIIDFSSFKKGIEILKKYKINLT
jgi:acyl carrier protein